MKRDLDIKEIRDQSISNMKSLRQGSPVRCPVNGNLLNVYWTGDKFNWDSPNTQKAHFISNSKAMLKKYGKDIIDHELNWCFVSGLVANNSLQIKNRPVLEGEIINDIVKAMLNKED